MDPLPADVAAHLARLPEPLRSHVAAALADPAKHRGGRRGPCPFRGAAVLRRWPSDCAAKVEALSVRRCGHPDSPGECSRADDPAHRVAGVRVCHGRGCPLA